jgi:hypothetical protein
LKASKLKNTNPQASTDPTHSNKLQGLKAKVLAFQKVAHNIKTLRPHKLSLLNSLPLSHKISSFSIRLNKPNFSNTYSHLPKGPTSPISETITHSTKIIGLTSPIP